MSKKNLDKKNRLRDNYIGFRMSTSENNLLNAKVRLSGLTKQDYIIKRLECKEIVVVGNSRVYKALRNELAQVLIQLQELSSGSIASDELLEIIKLITQTLDGMKEEPK